MSKVRSFPELSWQNAFKAIFIMPIRVPTMLVGWGFAALGATINQFGEWLAYIADKLPGFDPAYYHRDSDGKWVKIGANRRRSEE